MRKLLLISSSKTHGTGFLAHAADAIKQHLQSVRRVCFIPYALANHDAYARLAGQAFAALGIKLDSVHAADQPVEAIGRAEAVFTGGGNTFRLLKTISQLGLMEPLRRRALEGMPYIGSSAGTNITCPTIRTTNDMPIVEPPSFAALALVPFQINPHFIDADPNAKHQGESRETRLAEYLEENETPVIGIREGCWLHIMGSQGQVAGSHGAVLFARGQPPVQLSTGDSIAHLLN